jgi:2-polyprenyl-3-methyl-5-hydroxy-6-metoxy-1,4-benzoquinol methylase
MHMMKQKNEVFMNIQHLIKITQKPEIYTKGTAVMWTDKHISTQLLKTHLNPDVELASRKENTIAVTVEWILNKMPCHRLNILDLGCGPGLYTEKLAEKGHTVTGVDFSSTSICYARESAFKKKLNITYVKKNYLDLEEYNSYDLIMIIFTDFGVLLPEERKILLTKIYRALKPGGIFLFDVLNANFSAKNTAVKQWELSSKGFWKKRPYLALTESFYYETQKIILNQHTVIDEAGKVDIYRFWTHIFSHTELEKILIPHNFHSIECHDNVIPGCEFYRSKDVTFCLATK